MKRKLKWVMQTTAVVVIVSAVVPLAKAQSARERERAENDRELEVRSWNLKLLALSATPAPDKPRQTQQAVAQLQEDFTKIQVLNKKLGRAAIGKSALDLKFVAKSAAEIKKRAERLNTNLALPEPEALPPESGLAVTNPEQLKPPILKLAKLIFSFVDNPFFKEASVVDTQETSKARRDLEQIIELSDKIKKHSERLEKGGP